MGRVVVVNFVTIDGVIQAPLSPEEDRDGGFRHGGWVVPYSDQTVDALMEKSTVEAAALLLGRRSYDILAAAWAEADESNAAVAAMNRMPKYVATSSEAGLAWNNSHRLDGNIRDAVIAVRDIVDGDLVVFGASSLVRTLAELDLVDEYRLLVFPVVLGSGKRMFDHRGRLTEFAVTGNETSPSGVVILTYTRNHGH